MKRCPECRRDYYDDSLLYCLDDGSALLEGPSSDPGSRGVGTEGPVTAILHSTDAQSEQPTRAQIHTTSGEAEPPSSFRVSEGQSPSAHRTAEPQGQSLSVNRSAEPRRNLALVGGGILLILLVSFFGYRYVASSASGEIRSIAVLPFQNRSSDADTEYLSDGLAESLIYRLSQIPELKVSPRSSVFRYKGQDADAEKVGSELGVDAVMSGRLVQRGDNLTISVDLVDVRNKKTLWGEQFERKMSDLLATQREIASAITEKLQLKLSGTDSKGVTKHYTSSNEAYQLYMKGRFYWNKRTAENVNKSIELLKQAVDKDPQFALAYSALADSYVVVSTYTGERQTESMPLAKAYAQKAIELDPTLAEPHAALGLLNWMLDWNKEAAESEFKKSIELNPNYGTAHHWYSRFLRGIGRYEEGFAEIKRAEELDPLSLIFLNNIAETQINLGDLDAADKTMQRMLEMDPNFWATYQTLVWVRVKQKRYEDALTVAQKSVELSNRSNAAISQLGHVYGRLGRRDDAMKVVAELEEKFAAKVADGREIGVVYAGLGDKDRAFEWIEKGFAYRSFQLTTLNLDPLLEPLQDDPRWAELKRRVGIPQ